MAAVRFRTGAPSPLAIEPAMPPWAHISADYRVSVEAGHESAEFEDGAVRHAPTAASTMLRRRVRVEVAQDRIGDWRRFLATAPGRALRFRDPDDGMVRRATVEPEEGGIQARQVSQRGRGHWVSEFTLSGWSDDKVE